MRRRIGEASDDVWKKGIERFGRERGFRNDRDLRETRSLEDRDFACHVALF